MTPAVQSGAASRPPLRTTRRSFARSSLCVSPNLSLRSSIAIFAFSWPAPRAPGGASTADLGIKQAALTYEVAARGHRGGRRLAAQVGCRGEPLQSQPPGDGEGKTTRRPWAMTGSIMDGTQAGRRRAGHNSELGSTFCRFSSQPRLLNRLQGSAAVGPGHRLPIPRGSRDLGSETAQRGPPPPAGGRVAGPKARLSRGEDGGALGLGGCTAPHGGKGVSPGSSCDRRRDGENSREVDADEPGPARRQAELAGPTGLYFRRARLNRYLAGVTRPALPALDGPAPSAGSGLAVLRAAPRGCDPGPRLKSVRPLTSKGRRCGWPPDA